MVTVNKAPVAAAATAEPGKSITDDDNNNNSNNNSNNSDSNKKITEGILSTSKPWKRQRLVVPRCNWNAINAQSNDAGSSWTEEEQELFKMGIVIHGWGNWDMIAKTLPNKSISDMQSRALDMSRLDKEEETRLKDKHIQHVRRNPQLYSSEYVRNVNVRKVTALATSEHGAADGHHYRAMGLWTQEEHSQFEQACIQFGWGDWLNVTTQIPTRDKSQVKSHAQKFDMHHPGGRERLEKAHAEILNAKALRNAKITEKLVEERKEYGEDKTADDDMDIENGSFTVDEASENVHKVTAVAATLENDDEMDVENGSFTVDKASENVHKVTVAATLEKDDAADKSDTVVKDSGHQNRAMGLWTQEEHSQFEQACIQFGWGDWLNVTTQIPTRDKSQVKSHAQKFDMHHPGGRERLEKAHAEILNTKALQNTKKTEKAADEGKESGEDRTADDEMDVENGNSSNNKVDEMEVEHMNDEEGEKSTEGEDKETEGDEDGNTSDESRQQQQLRVSPRVVKAPKDNYMDSLQRDQWQRKTKKENPKKSNSSGVRKRHDGLHDVRVWFAGKFRHIGTFENEQLAKVAFRIAGDVLPDTAPTDPAAIDWNIQIARDAAIDGAKLAERDAEGEDGGVGLLDPKAMQNCLLGGHMVSAGEQTIKHRLFQTSTATKTETNLAHFTVTCSNGPIHVDVGIDDSLFDLRRKIFDQFDSSQLDDGNCNFNFQVDTNMISRKVEGSFIARDLLQLGKSVELIPRSAVLSGESGTDAPSENGQKDLNQVSEDDDDDDDDEDLTSFLEAESAAVSSKLMSLANDSANSQSSNSKVVNFIKSSLAENISQSYPELGHVYMMEQTGLHEKEVEQWISDAKNRCKKPVE